MDCPNHVLTLAFALALTSCESGTIDYEDLASTEQTAARKELLFATATLRCENPVGVTADWRGPTAPRYSKPSPMFEEPAALVFDAIDIGRGQARFVGNAGAEDVEAFATPAGLYFIERTPSGSVNMTTVFVVGVRAMPAREFFFVHSRHVAGFGLPPIVSQYSGKCVAQ